MGPAAACWDKGTIASTQTLAQPWNSCSSPFSVLLEPRTALAQHSWEGICSFFFQKEGKWIVPSFHQLKPSLPGTYTAFYYVPIPTFLVWHSISPPAYLAPLLIAWHFPCCQSIHILINPEHTSHVAVSGPACLCTHCLGHPQHPVHFEDTNPLLGRPL